MKKEVKEALLEMGTISEILIEESKFHITPKEAIEDIRKLNVGDNYFIIKQAFEDMKEERKQRDETEQSLSKWVVELQSKLDIQSKNLINVVNENVKLINYNLELKSKLDKVREVCDLTVINGLVQLHNYVPDKAIYKIKQILKEE